jgi:DUF1009 family protein
MTTGRTAILAGQGALPQALAAGDPRAVFVSFAGVPVDVPGCDHIAASFERFGALFDDLKNAGVTQVVFAGAMSRPDLNPALFDAKMMQLAPRLMAAMAGGDDGLLREVVSIFEAEGFSVVGAHTLLPALVADAGVLTGTAGDRDMADGARGREILAVLGPLDTGQGVVVAGGLCLGIETLQGTDAMLDFVARTPRHLRRAKGVMVKCAKPGQDLRVDMPAIGPETVAAARRAGLAGIVIAAGQVLILDRDLVLSMLGDAGMFLLAV